MSKKCLICQNNFVYCEKCCNSTKSSSKKSKNKQLGLHQTKKKKNCAAKETINEMKNKWMNQEKIFANLISDKKKG